MASSKNRHAVLAGKEGQKDTRIPFFAVLRSRCRKNHLFFLGIGLTDGIPVCADGGRSVFQVGELPAVGPLGCQGIKIIRQWFW